MMLTLKLNKCYSPSFLAVLTCLKSYKLNPMLCDYTYSFSVDLQRGQGTPTPPQAFGLSPSNSYLLSQSQAPPVYQE